MKASNFMDIFGLGPLHNRLNLLGVDLAAEYGEADATAYVEQARKTAKVQKNIELFDQQ